MAVQQFRQGFPRDPQTFRRRRHRQAQRFQAQFPDRFARMGRIMHCHGLLLLVIIGQIDVAGGVIFKAEHHPPVPRHFHRPKSGPLPLERVEP